MVDTKSMYLDLMEKCITGTIYQDAAMWPSAGVYDAERRRLGRDWPTMAHTMIGQLRIHHLRTLCETVLKEQVPGDFIETGIWRGGACILMRAVLAAYGDTTRKVWCADSFDGLPPPDPAAYPHDRGDVHHQVRQLAVSVEAVSNNFQKYGLFDRQVVFLKGWFKDTLPNAPIESISILRLDGDMYQSTIEALEALYPKLSRGGFIIVDDYNVEHPACQQAVTDYRTRNGITAAINPIDMDGVFWRK